MKQTVRLNYRAESWELINLHELKLQWCDLQQRADCSYFQSWGWIGTWLEQIADQLDPVLVEIWHENLLVGMGVFVSGEITRHSVLQSKAVFLNEAPFESRNMVIEYNGLLAAKKHEQAVYRETIQHVFKHFKQSDEFFFSALTENEVAKLQQGKLDDSQINLKVIEKSVTRSVALDTFEPGIEGFLRTLSKNRRAQIVRSIKIYEQQGPIELVEASNTAEALLFFDGLKALHTERWELKGGLGSFANPLWEKFHRALIKTRFAHGEVQLLRVNNTNGTMGYLYNCIWRNRVYVLQTGFKMSDDKHLMPGYVVHVIAIAHNKQKGMEVYDLLHGDSLYKKILCNQNQVLYWSVMQRKRLKFVIEDGARQLVTKLRGKS